MKKIINSIIIYAAAILMIVAIIAGILSDAWPNQNFNYPAIVSIISAIVSFVLCYFFIKL